MSTAAPADVDFGLFGPGSVAWRLHREPALLTGGLRALMIQALHPLTMAAVVQHSNYKDDVWARWNRTSDYVMTTIYGDGSAARQLGARVRVVHKLVRGVDRVTGLPYSADDPTLLLWIHCTLVDSFLLAYQRYVGGLAPTTRDRYVSEMVGQAALVGLAADDVPPTDAANRDFIERCRPDLLITPGAIEAMDTFLHPPLPAHRRPMWWVATTAALAMLPPWALEMYGMRRDRVAEAAAKPLIMSGGYFMRTVLKPPPILAQARAKAEAEGREF